MTHDEAGGSGGWRQMAVILEQVESICEPLERLSREILDSAAEGDVETLLDLLERRGELIGALAALAPDFNDAAGTFERIACELNEAERAALAGRFARIDEAGLEIARRDEETAKIFEARKSAMSAELSAIGNKSAAASAYAAGQSAGPTPRFQDREG